jgi:hypothetical protein
MSSSIAPCVLDYWSILTAVTLARDDPTTCQDEIAYRPLCRFASVVSNSEQMRRSTLIHTHVRMSAARSLLCIHRDPAQLMVLQEKGFPLISATHGSQRLRLLVSKPVDAVILEYHLGFWMVLSLRMRSRRSDRSSRSSCSPRAPRVL